MVGLWAVALVVGAAEWRGIDDAVSIGTGVLTDLEASRGAALVETRTLGTAASVEVVCARALPGGAAGRASRTSVDGRHADPQLSARVDECLDAPAGGERLAADEPRSAPGGGPTEIARVRIKGTPRDAIVRVVTSLRSARDGTNDAPSSVEAAMRAAGEELHRTAHADLRRGEAIGLGGALLVLVVLLRSLVAPLLPLLAGASVVAVAVGLASLAGSRWDFSFYVVSIMTMLGLALGIDYTLLVVQRYRAERARGSSTDAAVARTTGSAGRSVLVSGTIVAASLAGLLLVPIPVFRGIAAGALVAVAVGVLAALTLLPACLRLIGDRLDWPRRRAPAPPVASARAGRELSLPSLPSRHPVVCTVAAGVALLLLGIAALDLRLGVGDPVPRSPSEAEAAEAWRSYTVTDDVTAMVQATVEIAIDAVRTDEIERGVDGLVAAIGRDEAFFPIVAVQWNEASDLAIVTVPLVDGADDAAIPAVERLRDRVLPAAFAGLPVDPLVTGIPAAKADVVGLLNEWQPRIVGLVLGVSFVLLLLAFRSLVVAVVAILLNLASIGAALGLVELVFQDGYGAAWLGVRPAAAVDAWVPILLFCALFGLSMDYHVFLLSRIKEHHDLTGDTIGAVNTGLRETKGVITGAAAIMVVVFGCFAFGRVVILQQIGFGLAVAVLLDATVVRSLLLPATMTLLGERNWYLPRWLRWLPRIGSVDRVLDQAPPFEGLGPVRPAVAD